MIFVFLSHCCICCKTLFHTAANRPLPTRPVLKLYEIVGEQRMDHTQEIDMDKPIVFYRHIPAEDEPNCEINTVRYDR